MKPVKIFALSIFCLIVGLFVIELARTHFYVGQTDSPLLRIKMIFLIIATILIMKLTFTNEGFKMFVTGYICLWIIFYIVTLLSRKFHSEQLEQITELYKTITLILTPFPLIFFWFVDRIFNVVNGKSD